MVNKIETIKKQILRLVQSEEGAVIVLAGILTSVVLIVAVGVALDLTRGEIIQGRMTSALDAAGLAVEKQVQTVPAKSQQSWANAQALRYFNANFPLNYLGASQITPAVSPVTPDWKTVNVTASSSMNTLIMKNGNSQAVSIASSSQVTQSTGGNSLELALIMDNSSAMAQPMTGGGGSRISVLQNDAAILINTIFGNNPTLPNTHVSLIPYSDAVHLSPAIANPWLGSLSYSPLSDFQGCMVNRTDSNFATDKSPYTDSFPRYIGPFDTPGHIKVTGYSVYNAAHVTPDVTLNNSLMLISPIVNGKLTNDPTGQLAQMASQSQGTKPVNNGMRLALNQPTLDLPGGRLSDEIDFVHAEPNGKVVDNSEMLKIDFGAEYISSFANLYLFEFKLDKDPNHPDPAKDGCKYIVSNGCEEQGLWQSRDSNNKIISQGRVHGIPGSQNIAVTASSLQSFQSIDLLAVDDGNRLALHPNGLVDNSDFGVVGFDYVPLCSPLLQASFFLQDKASITYQLSQMQAAGPTRNDIGLAWGWFSLSPKWRGLLNPNVANVPADYNPNVTQKVAVILTQGTNIDPSYDANFSQICTNMKHDGITIYAIAFDVQSASVKTLLQNCASSTADYFDVPTAATLTSAFQSIGSAISAGGIRISK